MGLGQLKKRFLLGICATALLGAGFIYTEAPVNSVSTVTLTGTASSLLQLSAGNKASATIAGGTGAGGSITAANTDTLNFNTAVNFGNLTNGDGTNEVATVPIRVRGNSSCHVAWGVTSYTASNISYNGTALTGSAASTGQLTFITLGTAAMVSGGANANTTGAAYSGGFLAGNNMSVPNSGNVLASVLTGSDKYATFPNAPTKAGTMTGADNFIDTFATFSVPTGLAWTSTGASPAWNVTASFDIFSGP